MEGKRLKVDNKRGDVVEISITKSRLWFIMCNTRRTKNSNPQLTQFGFMMHNAGVPTEIKDIPDREKVGEFLAGFAELFTNQKPDSEEHIV